MDEAVRILVQKCAVLESLDLTVYNNITDAAIDTIADNCAFLRGPPAPKRRGAQNSLTFISIILSKAAKVDSSGSSSAVGTSSTSRWSMQRSGHVEYESVVYAVRVALWGIE